MRFLLLFFLPLFLYCAPKIELGVDVFFAEETKAFEGKKIGLITNQTGVSSSLQSTLELFLERKDKLQIAAVFAPEHGLSGVFYAAEKIDHSKSSGLTVYSLHGESRRPSEKMLQGIDVLIYDIQEIGIRPYTYATTLYYVMEEAAKKKIPVVILDRPNPMGGTVVDGPMLQEKMRSFLGYLNVPYCHGMTIGELAKFFNEEYQVGCDLKVISMRGWKRNMTFMDTGLNWIPTSPNIPEPDTPFYCASTGIIGELDIVSIGIGYTLPFKIVGAPWISGKEFADRLNGQKLPGVFFAPLAFRPFYGTYKGLDCEGIKIIITDYAKYRPLAVQYLILGLLKTLYPKEFTERLKGTSPLRTKLFSQVNGTEEIYQCLLNEKYIAWKLIEFQKEEREAFLQKREKYLLYK